MGIETREDHYNAVLEHNKANPDDRIPVSEIVMPGKGIMSDDVNSIDVRFISDDGETFGPWRKTKEEAEADAKG